MDILSIDVGGLDEFENGGLGHLWAKKALRALDVSFVAEAESGARGSCPSGRMADEAGADGVELGVFELGEDGVGLEEIDGVVGFSVPELTPMAAILVDGASEEGV